MSKENHNEIKHEAEPGFIQVYYIALAVSAVYLLYTFI